MDATHFHADLDKFAAKLKIKRSTVIKKVALSLWTEMTSRVPVDTGRLRASFDISEGAPSTRLDEYKGAKTGSIPAPELPDVGEITGEQSVFISSNINYASFVEYGTEKMAPNGYRQGAMQKVAADIERVAEEVKE